MAEKILVLTLWEPWATLYAWNEKEYETRPSTTSHRGIYLIHAAQKFTKDQKELCQQEPFASALSRCGIKDYMDFKLGHIIGKYNHTACYNIVDASRHYPHGSKVIWHTQKISREDRVFRMEENEVIFGDWSSGRFAWGGTDKQVFSDPLPYKNGQGYYQHFKGDISWLNKQGL